MIQKPTKFLVLLSAAAGLSLASNASAATFLIDFGLDIAATGSNEELRPTVGPDSNNNYWNNVYSTGNAGSGISGGTGSSLANLISVTNSSSTISLTLVNGTQPWSASGGRGFGGLLSPSQSLLGTFAQTSATRDYYFVGSGGNAGITISGLDPNLTYNFSFFGTRNNTETRTTRYTITGNTGSSFVDLQTSGVGIGTNTAAYPAGQPDGNDDQIVSLNGMVPNPAGVLQLQLSNVNGAFSYLGAMQITSVPEPGVAALSGFAALALLFRKRRQA